MPESDTANPIETVAGLLNKADQPAEATAVAVTTESEQGKPDEDEELGDKGKQALDRMKAERNEAKRQAADLKAKLDKIESANLTELERAQREAETAKAEAAQVPEKVAEHLRGYLARVHEISDEDAELYLTSTDPDVLLKQAAGIAARRTATTTPKPDLTQGAQSAMPLNGDGLTEALARAVGAG